jgi:hypothetical protein
LKARSDWPARADNGVQYLPADTAESLSPVTYLITAAAIDRAAT